MILFYDETVVNEVVPRADIWQLCLIFVVVGGCFDMLQLSINNCNNKENLFEHLLHFVFMVDLDLLEDVVCFRRSGRRSDA